MNGILREISLTTSKWTLPITLYSRTNPPDSHPQPEEYNKTVQVEVGEKLAIRRFANSSECDALLKMILISTAVRVEDMWCVQRTDWTSEPCVKCVLSWSRLHWGSHKGLQMCCFETRQWLKWSTDPSVNRVMTLLQLPLISHAN